MGRYVKPAGEGATKQYWYPGQRSDYIHAGIVLGAGLLTAGLVGALSSRGYAAAVVGLTVAAGLAGLYLGQRDGKAMRAGAKPNASTISASGLRAFAKGAGAAIAAIVITRAATGGFWAVWVVPLLPALAGAMIHQISMTKKPGVKRLPIKASESEVARSMAARKAQPATSEPTVSQPTVAQPVAPEPAGQYAVAEASYPGRHDGRVGVPGGPVAPPARPDAPRAPRHQAPAGGRRAPEPAYD